MPRRRSPALTDAEARVMSVLWRRQTATVADVVSVLKKETRRQLQHREKDPANPRRQGSVFRTRKWRGPSSFGPGWTNGRPGAVPGATW